MDIISVAEQLEGLYNQVDAITDTYHQSKTEFENLDKQSKPLLAQIASGKEGSESQRNREALADTKTWTHLAGVEEARRAYNRSWALLEGLRLKLDVLRSLNKNLN